MAKTSGTEVNIGIGIESLAAPGTAVAEAYFIPWSEFSLQSVAEKDTFKSSRGLRNEVSNSMIKRKYSKGSIGFVPNVEVMPFLLSLALGSVSSSSVSDSAYTHTFAVQNTNVSVRTATITVEQGGVETAQYTNCVCNSLNLEVSDSYAKVVAEFIGKFGTTDTISESFSKETEFAYHQMTAKFGTSFSNAAGNSATPLKSFSLNINNNILEDEAFLSGSNGVVTGGLIPGRLSISGSYSLHFADTTELAKYRANTKNALIVTFTGELIGASSLELITFKLGKLILTAPPLEYNIDGLTVLNQEFTVEWDTTDYEISAIVVNDQANGSGTRYNPA
jgi:hypothetical protein